MFKKAVELTSIVAVTATLGLSQVIAAEPSNGVPHLDNAQRLDYGWGGNGGGNLEMYSSTSSIGGTKGQLRFVYGGGDFGAILFYKYDPNAARKWTVQSKIDKNGNWGIGTETICPDCKLSVNGKIRATEIVVESGWADYVLQPSYQLRPLEDVEAYIKENQHLPGVDSAATIEENGLDISKASIQMMEKIEELTLYMIELKKQNDHLQREVALLKQKDH